VLFLRPGRRGSNGGNRTRSAGTRLTQEQSDKIEAIFQKNAARPTPAEGALDKAEADFNQMVEASDDAQVMAQVSVVEAARSELNKSRTMMLLRMRRVLTPDQRVKFVMLQQQTRNNHGRSGDRIASNQARSTNIHDHAGFIRRCFACLSPLVCVAAGPTSAQQSATDRERLDGLAREAAREFAAATAPTPTRRGHRARRHHRAPP
jgi:Spy/CpxP family protein refolding chaperone